MPEGQAPACKENTSTTAVDPQSTASVDAAVDAPPPLDAKLAKVQDKGEENAEAKPRPKTKTVKKRARSLRREVERLFSVPGKYLSGD
ncbi:MAG TPA: hypothetical protein VMW57_04515 [Methyloceanibacter sp.]|nr:hypothetical protein [Methyloceanibacter sp.]